MSAVSGLLAALSLVTPPDGALVPTLGAGQRTFLTCARAEIALRMDNPADRAKLFVLGGRQQPVRLVWSGETNAVYELSIAAEGGDEESFVLTNRTVAWVTNLSLDRKYHWMVRRTDTDETAAAAFRTESMPPRLLRADGVDNFRDLGGWRTADGHRVKEDMIYRSAGLRSSSRSSGGFLRRKVEPGERRVTDIGLQTLKNDFKIRTDLELRTPEETAGMNGTLLGADVRWVNVSFAAYDFIDNVVRGREPFAKIFRVFLDKANYPILMHCSGGRDRTGTLAFLLNGLLGVSEDDLCRDWAASVLCDQGAKFTSDRIQRLVDYLQTFPGDTLAKRIEAYVRGCGITDEEIACFRAIMLEPAPVSR